MLSKTIYKLSQIIQPLVNAGVAQKNAIQFFRSLLKGTSFQSITYVSGGYVRDIVMGVQSNDLDLVVQDNGGSKQLSDFILNLFDGFVTYEKLNPSYPTYNLLFKDNILYENKKYLLKGADIDISDTAKARYSQDSGKKQLFVYGDLYDDSLQRDFTINSLYLSIKNNKIIDPTQLGIKDIKNNLLRLIPHADFQEKLFNNPKVLLRYCRFYAKYKMNVIKSDIQIMKKYSDRISTLENQQIEKEINKIPQDSNSLFYARRMMSLIGIFEYLYNYFD